MLSLCVPCVPTDGVDLQGLSSAGSDAKILAEETSARCVSTQTKGKDVVTYAQEIKTTLGDLNSKMTPASFMAILDLLNNDKMKSTMALAGEMDDLAVECVTKTTEMSTVLQRGVDSFPAELSKDAVEEDTEGDTDPEVSGFEKDITDLEECTEGLRSMNVFTAATKGTSAFEGLANKGSACQAVFARMQELCASIAKLSQTVMMDSCCAQIQAGAASLKDMLKCLRLSNLVTTLAQLGRRLIEAILQLVKVAWEKFSNFLDEFDAAKKLKSFVNGLSPSKPKEGTFMEGAANLMGFIPGSSSASARGVSSSGSSAKSPAGTDDDTPQTGPLCCV